MLRSIILTSLFLIGAAALAADEAKAERVVRLRARSLAAAGVTHTCSEIVPLGNLIWKGCAGSGHLSKDPRGQGVALIARQGARVRPGFSCMPILNQNFVQLTGIQLYPGNDPKGPYAWRAYSNFGCGRGVTQSKLKTLSQNKPIYVKVNKAGLCISLPKAFVNINSSQRC